jgi:flagellar biosynthesis GTPase FlhF
MEADEIARAFSFMGAEKMIITKIDAARRFGSVLNAVASTQLKIANITGTEKILGAFDAANAEIITKLFFAYKDAELQNKEEIEDF